MSDEFNKPQDDHRHRWNAPQQETWLKVNVIALVTLVITILTGTVWITTLLNSIASDIKTDTVAIFGTPGRKDGGLKEELSSLGVSADSRLNVLTSAVAAINNRFLLEDQLSIAKKEWEKSHAAAPSDSPNTNKRH
jgi:hypothetical protein